MDGSQPVEGRHRRQTEGGSSASMNRITWRGKEVAKEAKTRSSGKLEEPLSAAEVLHSRLPPVALRTAPTIHEIDLPRARPTPCSLPSLFLLLLLLRLLLHSLHKLLRAPRRSLPQPKTTHQWPRRAGPQRPIEASQAPAELGGREGADEGGEALLRGRGGEEGGGGEEGAEV